MDLDLREGRQFGVMPEAVTWCFNRSLGHSLRRAFLNRCGGKRPIDAIHAHVATARQERYECTPNGRQLIGQPQGHGGAWGWCFFQKLCQGLDVTPGGKTSRVEGSTCTAQFMNCRK
jgi:hypothetical protein